MRQPAAAPVIGLYVLDEASPGLRPLGGAARWWLAQSLRALGGSLQAKGATLVLRQGPAARIIPAVAREAGASAVFWNEIAQAPHIAVAKAVEAALAKDRIDCKSFPGDLLVSPNAIRNKDGRGLRVFTPFWRRVLALGDPPSPLPAPKSLRPAEGVQTDTIESLGLEPRQPDWAGGLRETWTVGEKAAQMRLKAFLAEGVKGYAVERDRPDRDGTSSALAASALRRDQPAPGLARRPLCRGRASWPRRRYREIPRRIGLARVLPASPVRRARSRQREPAARLRRLPLEA